jgi:hypothetical protein
LDIIQTPPESISPPASLPRLSLATSESFPRAFGRVSFSKGPCEQGPAFGRVSFSKGPCEQGPAFGRVFVSDTESSDTVFILERLPSGTFCFSFQPTTNQE